MKKLSLLLLLPVLCPQLFFGQSGISGGNAIPNIVPPAPEAYSIARFGGNQIGLNTGTVVYSMPLYTIKVGEFSLPLSISYGSNGVKVDELPSRVGMQWKMDFAGVINRTIVGDPDESGAWYSASNDVTSDYFYSFLHEVAYGQGNGAYQPDQFNYSVPGYSGKFYVDTGGRIVQVPYNNVKFNRNYFYGFQLTTPDGTVYNFTMQESSLNAPGGGDYGTCYPEKLGQPATTAWYLSSIHLTNGDSIKYVYDYYGLDSTVKTLTGINQTYTFQGGKYDSDPNYHYTGPNITTCYQVNQYSYIALKEIQFPTGKVKLSYSSREDIPGDKKLDSLQVITTAGQVVKRYKFNYRYAYNSSTVYDGPPLGSYNSVQAQYPELRKRLFLTGVDDRTGSDTLSWKFDYNAMDSLPPRLSYSQDYWGYYNGIVNAFLIPAYTYAGTLDHAAGVEFGADRRGNFASSSKGILTRITYPTGGYTDYNYQPGAVQGYLKYKPAYDTIHLSGTLTSPIEHKDTVTLNNGIMKLSITSTAPPLDVDPETELVPDTLIYISIKTLSGTEIFTYNGPVWNSYSTPYLQVTDSGRYVVSVLTNYPPYVNWSMTLYSPLEADSLPQLPMGGVMVKSLADNDGLGHVQNRKSFIYGYKAGDLPYNYSDDEGMFYSFVRGLSADDNKYPYGLTQITSNTNYPLYINDMATLPYSSVREQWTDSSGKIYGGIDHEYLVVKRTNPVAFGTEDYPEEVTHYTKEIVPGTSSSNDDLHNGLELSTNTFKMMDTVRFYTSKTRNVYSVDTRPSTKYNDTIYTLRLDLDRAVRFVGTDYFLDYDVNRYIIYSNWMHLDSTFTTSYSDAGDSLSTVQAYEYGDSSHMQPTAVASFNSKGQQLKTVNKYPDNFATSPYTSMVSRNIITPVVEQTQKNMTLNKELTHTLTNYAFWQDTAFIRPASVQKSNMGATLQTEVVFDKYDAKANILQFTARDNVTNAFVWDYNGQYPVAKAVNADSISIAYTSFEADGSGGWTIGSATRDSVTAAITGTKSYNLSNGNLSKGGLTSGRIYIVSYWSTNGAKSISGGSGSSRTGRTVGSWTYYEHAVTASSSTITVSGSGSIDEVRLFPAGAQMMTYTYIPLVGLSSMADTNGEVSYYEYDDFNRLKFIKDYQGNIIKNFVYKYGQLAH